MRLDTRASQWVGVAVVLGWTALVAFGIPRLAAVAPREQVVSSGAAVTAGGVSLTPPDGWSSPKGLDAVIVLRKGGAQVTGLPPQPAKTDARAIMGTLTAPLKQDPSTDWQIGEPQGFTTNRGAEGVYTVALSPQQFITNFVVVIEGKSYQVIATGTDTDWTQLNREIVDLVKTLEPSGATS